MLLGFCFALTLILLINGHVSISTTTQITIENTALNCWYSIHPQPVGCMQRFFCYNDSCWNQCDANPLPTAIHTATSTVYKYSTGGPMQKEGADPTAVLQITKCVAYARSILMQLQFSQQIRNIQKFFIFMLAFPMGIPCCLFVFRSQM